MVHKRSENKLQDRKDKSFSKRKKVSRHSNRLEWLLGLPVVFQIFLDRYSQLSLSAPPLGPYERGCAFRERILYGLYIVGSALRGKIYSTCT